MTTVKWKFSVEDKPHEVVMKQKGFTSYEIWLDGQMLRKWRILDNSFNERHFDINGHPVELVIVAGKWTPKYYILVDDQPVYAKPRDKKALDDVVQAISDSRQLWIDLGKQYGLEYHQAKVNQVAFQNRLIGFINGFLVVLRPGFRQVNDTPVGGAYLFIRHDFLEPERIKEIKHDSSLRAKMKEMKILPDWIQIGNNMTVLFTRFISRKETDEEWVTRAMDLFSFFSTYIRPPFLEKCEGPLCKLRVGPTLQLAFVNENPLILCQDCIDRFGDVGKANEQEYKNSPSDFSKGLLAGGGVTLLGTLIWAIIAMYIDKSVIFVMLAAVWLYTMIMKAMGRVQTKKTRLSLLAGGVLAILGIMLGLYIGSAGSSLREQGLTLSFANFLIALKPLLNDPGLLFGSLFFIILVVGLAYYLGASNIKDYQKSLFQPEVEVISSFKLH
jgi:hypothetical protein